MSASYSQTEIAAMLELNFSEAASRKKGDSLSDLGLDGFTIVDIGKFERVEYKDKYPDNWICNKAIVVKDAKGNLYVHFNGTGDGNWPYNSVAYGPQNGKITSSVQDWALNYFDQTVAKYYDGQAEGKLYVSGHSQGGNNAQFVTIRSQYGDYIERCTSLDGPGFSKMSIEEAKALYGEAYFERQRNKIYACNGEYDYVSCLGQEKIVPEGHTQYIAYDYEHNKFDFGMFHGSNGLFMKDDDGNYLRDENGKFILGDIGSEYSDFRALVLALNGQILELPEDQQQDIARLVMKLCENMLGGGETITVNLSAEEKERLAQLLAPVLAGGIEDNHGLIQKVLLELGLDSVAVESIGVLIGEFNELPEGIRREAMEALAGFGIEAAISVANGEGIPWDKLASALPALAAAIPVIVETALHHPADLMNVIRELGLDEALLNVIKEHPGITIAVVTIAIVCLPAILEIATAIMVIDAFIHIVGGVLYIGGKAAEFILHLLNAAKELYEKVKEWFRNTFNAGVKYAQNNPYISLDTVTLRSYATRLAGVNNRLKRLDGDLNSLYWQVGLLDLWDILAANLLTGQSYALSRVQDYLSSAADDFDAAETKSRVYIGG